MSTTEMSVEEPRPEVRNGKEQAEYIGVEVTGPFKSDHYRY